MDEEPATDAVPSDTTRPAEVQTTSAEAASTKAASAEPVSAEMVTNFDVLVERLKENRILVTIGVALILVLAVVAYSLIGGSSDAPELTVTDSKGNTFTLSDYEGEKVVILDFMFSTCTYCNQLVDEVIEPYFKKMDKDEVMIISLSILHNDEEEEKIDEMADDHGWRHALLDEEGKYQNSFEVKATPTIVIVDKKGKITFHNEGKLNKDDLEDEVDKALTGRAGNVKVKETSIYLFAIATGFTLFFSPCAFPLLPGYMSYYLANKMRSEEGRPRRRPPGKPCLWDWPPPPGSWGCCCSSVSCSYRSYPSSATSSHCWSWLWASSS